ncbi:glucose 1-dehydrogenase [Puerhibacterium puerhi]|uniref:glucose 1-dehydrogenase n=1 Tax=Puerhibacterium puerhi TaxID=2692623 RepID=UPI00135AA2CE|nr:glucose 1-dehydrogenase [Puerhibacterium puerhi]
MTGPFSLAGRTAVVTGGGRGLGAGITEALLAAGADVVVLARRDVPEELAEAAARLGRTLEHVAVDLGDADAVDAAADEMLGRRRVDVLVNNAGVQDRYPAAEFPLEAWDRVLDVNLRVVFQLAQRFGRPMLERGEGAIVNLASLLSFQGGLNVAAYAASKGGVAQLTKALANEWAARGVRVNAVAPGYMATEMNEALLADPARLEQLSARIPAGRWGTPEDIGNVVVFLASPAAAYVHGQVLAVDGGWMGR